MCSTPSESYSLDTILGKKKKPFKHCKNAWTTGFKTFPVNYSSVVMQSYINIALVL